MGREILQTVTESKQVAVDKKQITVRKWENKQNDSVN